MQQPYSFLCPGGLYKALGATVVMHFTDLLACLVTMRQQLGVELLS